MNLQKEVDIIFKDRFDIPQDADVIVCPWPAIVSAEIVFFNYGHLHYTLQNPLCPTADLFRKMAKNHGKTEYKMPAKVYLIHYDEILSSTHYSIEKDYNKFRFVYSDKIFPYYKPINCCIWTAGLDFLYLDNFSVIVVKKELFRKKKTFYKNLNNSSLLLLKSMVDLDENPLLDFGLRKVKKALTSFDMKDYKEKIAYNRKIMEKFLGHGGEGTVFRTNKHVSLEIADRYDIKQSEYGTHIDLLKTSLEIEGIAEAINNYTP